MNEDRTASGPLTQSILSERAAGIAEPACSAPPCEATKDGKHRLRTFIRRGPGDRVCMYPRCTKCGHEPNEQVRRDSAAPGGNDGH